MSRTIPITESSIEPPSACRMAAYVFGGGAAGLVIGLAALYLVAAFQGYSLGNSFSECAAIGCALALFLSQPAGIGGMAAGAVVGAIVGGLVCHARHGAK